MKIAGNSYLNAVLEFMDLNNVGKSGSTSLQIKSLSVILVLVFYAVVLIFENYI